jgi:hypothetical protein
MTKGHLKNGTLFEMSKSVTISNIFSTTKPQCSSESADTLISELRGITLRVGTLVVERCAELFCVLRNELTTEDLRRNAAVLQQSPVVNVLVPYTIAHLVELNDSKVYININFIKFFIP